jgi:TIR domain
MATVREHYDIDAKRLNGETAWKMEGVGINQHMVLGKISYCFEENAKYWSIFFPEESTASCIENILRMQETAHCLIPDVIPLSQHVVGYADRPESYPLEIFKFTGRIYLYIDKDLSPEVIEYFVNLGTLLELSVLVRDRGYVKKCSELMRSLAFISHDSRDKDSFVRELAFEMSLRLCSVWYDEFSLKVGDSLRENIERGLKEARKCVVILSPNFLSNGGWSKVEFDSIYTREIHEKANVILPVWHNVEKNEVYNYSPRLADKVALSSSLGVKELAKKLVEAINK